MNNSLNVYPSTSDFRRIAGGQDATLILMEGALKRYKRYGTSTAYVGGGSVCALGAIIREAGVTPKIFEKDETEIDFRHIDQSLIALDVEDTIANAAREALDLLNESAVRLYPESGGHMMVWHGPLEYINQNFRPFEDAKKAVVAVYKDAIERRKVDVN